MATTGREQIEQLRFAADAARVELDRARTAYRALDESISLFERVGRIVDLTRARTRVYVAEVRVGETTTALNRALGGNGRSR